MSRKLSADKNSFFIFINIFTFAPPKNGAELKLGNQYIIPFKGLKDGEHEFEFNFDKLFFDKHDVLEVRDGQVKARVLLNKKTQLLTLAFELTGLLEVQCDRCLEYFNLPIEYRNKLIVKFGDNVDESADDIWIIHPGENELNLEQYFFECIGLSIPLKKVHSNDVNGNLGCNADMLKKIQSLTATTEKESEKTDPRWNKLKDFLNENNFN